MPRRALSFALVAFILTVPSNARGDDLPSEHVVVESPGVRVVVPKDDGPRIFGLPIGSHIVAPPAWDRLDVELKRLQEKETRIEAENKSLRETAKSWQPGWKVVLSTLIVGVIGGAYVGTRF